MHLRESGALINLFGLVVFQAAVFTRRSVSKRIYYKLATIGSCLLMISNWLISLEEDVTGRLILGVVGIGYGGLAGYFYARWRKHKDDDDDFGKRAKRWLTNRLPKPRVRRTRTTELSPASSSPYASRRWRT